MKKLFSLLMACSVLAGLLTVVHTSSAAPSRVAQDSAAAQVTQVALLEPGRAGEPVLAQGTVQNAPADDADTPLAVNTGLLAAAAVLTLWALRRRLF